MSVDRVQQIVRNCYEGGFHWESSFRKVPALASAQTVWADLSGAPGNPKPNYYVGAEKEATLLSGVNGLYHGGDVAPKTKHLHKFLVSSTGAGVTPAKFWLMDYLMFYPLVDMDSTDEQELFQTATLPRYADGDGVKAFLVATNPYIGGATFWITYTNQDGVSGQQSRVETSNTTTFIGTIIHSGTHANASGPFIRLAPGDTGIRSVQSITFLAPNGGLAALVLAKPIAVAATSEIAACAEWDYLTMKPTLPRLMDGAYINMICCPNGSFSAVPITGLMTVIWN